MVVREGVCQGWVGSKTNCLVEIRHCFKECFLVCVLFSFPSISHQECILLIPFIDYMFFTHSNHGNLNSGWCYCMQCMLFSTLHIQFD